MTELVKTIDEAVTVFSEELARRLNRRRFLINGAKGLAAAVAAACVGGIGNVREAFAITCSCTWISGSGNANCPHWSHQCPQGAPACPSGCSFCTINDLPKGANGYGCYGWCDYSGGQWVSCTGLCTGQQGYKVCSDCKCSTCNGYLCTCLSSIQCCNCLTLPDAQAEMAALHLN
jgi:hypothetical protein